MVHIWKSEDSFQESAFFHVWSLEPESAASTSTCWLGLSAQKMSFSKGDWCFSVGQERGPRVECLRGRWRDILFTLLEAL